MNTNFWMLVAVAMTSALSQACTAEAGSVEDVQEEASELRLMNGSKLSGVSLNGANFDDATLDGVNYAGITIGGVAISNVYLSGTVLHGTLPNGVALSGADFIGAELSGSMSDGSTLQLRIDNIETSVEADILHYTVSFRDPSSGSFQSLCGVDANNAAIKAFPFAGVWDNTQGTKTGGSHSDDADHFTMACRGAAIAKCAELGGYKPWETKEVCTSWGECSTVSLAAAHQACIRMVRADYCGNGDSNTYTGTEIDMYDGLGVKDADPTATWDLEAEWTPSGAQCVSHVRWANVNGLSVEEYIQNTCPEKWAAMGTGVACGEDDSTFFQDNGFMTSDDERVFLRDKSFVHQ